MYICNFSLIIEKRPFKGSPQLLLEKTNTLNKKWIQVFPGLTTVTYKGKNVFLGTATSWIITVFYDLLFR